MSDALSLAKLYEQVLVFTYFTVQPVVCVRNSVAMSGFPPNLFRLNAGCIVSIKNLKLLISLSG